MLNDLVEFARQPNIATLFDEDTLNKLGDKVVQGYKQDVDDRADWDQEMKDAMDLALQIMEEKTFPWKGASNVKMPLLTEAAIQYNARMYPALIPSSDIVKPRIVGNDPDGQKRESSIRVSKHMSFQMLEEMDEWEEEMDRGLIVQPILGNMYKKTYYCPEQRRNISEMLSPVEFFLCNNAKSLEQSYRKTHAFPLSENDYRSHVLMGNYLEQELGQGNYKREDIESAGITHEYLALEQHTWADLDNDGYEEPYIVTVEESSKKVLRIVAGYDVDEILHVNGNIIKVPQEQYFTKYGFIPNPDGSIMDLGLGKLLGPTNHTVNTLINQLVDAGTRQNMGGGFLGRGVRIKGGKMRFSMGEYKRVDSTGDDLRKNIVDVPTPQPSATLFSLLGLLINSGQRLASTLDSQVGENPGQNQKATTTLAVQEEGKRIFGGIYKRNHRALKKEIKRLFYLNSIYLPPESYLNVLDGIPEDIGETIKRTDYDVKAVNIVPTADSQYVPQQIKAMKAQSLLQKIPTGMVNPQVAMKRALEAEEQVGIDEIMNVKPPPPSFDQIKLQQEMQYKYAELHLRAISEERQGLEAQSTIILNLAKAEAEEGGTQMNQYMGQLEVLRAMMEANAQRRQEAEANLSEAKPTS